jgi:DNA-binding IscR family transcriptional regulator
MALSFGSSANNFTTFLGTVNNTRTGQGPREGFNLETAAKQALTMLASRPSGENTMFDKELRDKLNISDDQLSQVIGHLEQEEMILPRSRTGDMVTLSDFAAEALKIFDVT